MAKSNQNRKKPTFFTWAFLVLALLFLALGLGTLGSVQTVGKSYEMFTEIKNGSEVSEYSVVFRLDNIKTAKEDGTSETTYLHINELYLNIAEIYSEAGTDAEIKLTRGTSSTSFPTTSSYNTSVKLENLKKAAPVTDEKGNVTESNAVEGALCNWLSPFGEYFTDASTYNVSSSGSYYKLTASCNLLINEIVFVGEKLDGAGGKVTGEKVVIPTTIYKATPLANETSESANARAGALIDAQHIPTDVQSTFYRIGKEELAVMTSVIEMRSGSAYNAANVYHGDRVYNSLGISLVAFGTVIFGISPFGLRFFPMLASFGVLVIGYFLVKAIAKSERAGLIFALIYSLCNYSMGLGHLGTPLMIGVFFLAASFLGAYLFFANGMKKGNFQDALPLILSGVCGAAAVCTSGVFLIPVAGVVGLFAAGLVRLRKQRRAELDEAIAEAEAEEAVESGKSAPVKKQEPAAEGPTGKAKVAKVLGDYRRKTTVSCGAFFTALVACGILFTVLFLLPVYHAALRLYDNPANPSNAFTLTAKLFAGGFVGENIIKDASNPWGVFYVLFRGTGETYALTALVINVFSALAGLLGIAYAVYRMVIIFKRKEGKKELYKIIALLAAMALCLITAAFAKGALAFLMLAYFFAFVLGAEGVEYGLSLEGKGGKIAKGVAIGGLVLLIAFACLCAVFTFSVPLSASFVSKF